jgi:site-specific recombinase XerD
MVLTRKEALIFLRAAEQYKHPLETVVVTLLLHAGLRSSEICALTIGDLHLTPRESRLFIRGQVGKKMRFVYLTTRATAAMRRYCTRRGIRMFTRKRRNEFLLTQRNGKPLTQQVIDHIIKRIGKLAGVPSVTPTMLRNTCAVQLLLNGESASNVARTLGMVSIKNLERYVEELKKEADEASNDTSS